MRAITQDTYGGPDLMVMSEVEPPEICADQLRTFPLAEAADAMRYLDHRAGPGKVVVT